MPRQLQAAAVAAPVTAAEVAPEAAAVRAAR